MGLDAAMGEVADRYDTAPPIGDEVSRDEETSQQDNRWSPGQERQIGTKHESQNRKELEH